MNDTMLDGFTWPLIFFGAFVVFAALAEWLYWVASKSDLRCDVCGLHSDAPLRVVMAEEAKAMGSRPGELRCVACDRAFFEAWAAGTNAEERLRFVDSQRRLRSRIAGYFRSTVRR